MDWESPLLLLLAVPAVVLLLWIEQRSAHPMSALRKRWLLVVRSLGVMLAIAALAGPAKVMRSGKRSVVLLLDHSQSMGDTGLRSAIERAKSVAASLPAEAESMFAAIGAQPEVIRAEEVLQPSPDRFEWQRRHGSDSNYGLAVEFASALFPPGRSRQIVIVGDGHETRGSLADAACHAAAAGIQIHVAAVAGERRPDVRVQELAASRSRLHEGASLNLRAAVESTVDASGVLKLFENGVEIESRPLSLRAGERRDEAFTRSPAGRNTFKYRVEASGFAADTLTVNNDALAIVDVQGGLRLLYLESDAGEGQYLMKAMEKEGISLDLRQPGSIPQTLGELSGYDGIIISGIAAHQLGDAAMNAIRDHVDKLGGGLIMLGGPNSFGVGGYYRTPIEDALPVRLKSPDEEEKQSAAVALVIDRSGSMTGEKLEMAKSAAIATTEVLSRSDHIGVYAFDSDAHVVAPMARITSLAGLAAQISTVAPGGGTHLMPAFTQAREALQRVKAKVKHMIILTDGQTSGGGYEGLASQCRAEGITISTVAIGEGSHIALLQGIAAAGGGQAYSTTDTANISRIFTQDTLMHTGRMIREEPFEPVLAERHPMLAGFEKWTSPALLGYVRTLRKSTAQAPLTSDLGDPLLAHWRFGLGKATAFTSDAKSRWASLWITRWDGFGRFWSQVLRETARPPQGRNMDIATEMRGDDAWVTVDLLADAGTRKNSARIDAEVFFVAADVLGSPLGPAAKFVLRQDGPGLYTGSFRPGQPGVYQIIARSGAEMVTAGLVFNPSSEASLGTVNEKLLRDTAAATGGEILEGNSLPAASASNSAVQHVELWPQLVLAVLLLFLADVAIRRWEHVAGFASAVLETVARGSRQ